MTTPDDQYAEMLGHSKSALMKAGQILSMVDTSAMSTGGFAPYQKALVRLQTDVPPIHPDLLHRVLDEELGSVHAHFRDFDDEPYTQIPIPGAPRFRSRRAVLSRRGVGAIGNHRGAPQHPRPADHFWSASRPGATPQQSAAHKACRSHSPAESFTHA